MSALISRPPPPKRTAWHGLRWGRAGFSFRAILWLMIYPQRGQRTGLTVSGLLLVALSLAVGMAAYNSASNILFLTLSLLLGCLILSGVLSWVNFRRLRWRLDLQPPLRAGREHVVGLWIRNGKRFLPTYGIWFEVELESSRQRIQVPLQTRLDPGSETRLECGLLPTRRGIDRVRLRSVGSFFPFGFLRKVFTIDLEEEVIVWPAAIQYRIFPSSALQRVPAGDSIRRVGLGGDLLSLRRYQMDDSHRQIHWKASARLRQLMVRQTAAEAGESFTLWVDTSADLWPRPEQFELLCSLAASLANDLFSRGRLRFAGVGDRALVPMRRLSDLEAFLDALSLAAPHGRRTSREPAPYRGSSPNRLPGRKNSLTFAPDGDRAVCAYVNGEKAATS